MVPAVGFYKKGGKTRPITRAKARKTRVVRREVRPSWDISSSLGHPRVGYSSHGNWTTFGNIKELEIEERDNSELVPVADKIPDDWWALWICLNPREALRYTDEYFNNWDVVKAPLTKKLREDIEFYLAAIDILPTDYIVADDGDDGYLLIRPNLTGTRTPPP